MITTTTTTTNTTMITTTTATSTAAITNITAAWGGLSGVALAGQRPTNIFV